MTTPLPPNEDFNAWYKRMILESSHTKEDRLMLLRAAWQHGYDKGWNDRSVKIAQRAANIKEPVQP